MANTKNFNLLKYVYGQLFLHSLETARSSMIVESWKFYKGWYGILKWLQEQKYISCLQVIAVDSQQKQITYVFNYDHLMYKPYLKYLQRLTNSRTIKLQA